LRRLLRRADRAGPVRAYGAVPGLATGPRAARAPRRNTRGNQTMKAYRIEETEDGPRGRLVDVEITDLDPGEVVVRTRYAGINYKDALAGTGRAPIVRRYPCIGGIEATGIVESSDSPDFRPGD